MVTEHDIQNAVRVALTKAGHQVFRTNVGSVRLPDGRYFDTGLPKGHADLYGFRPDGQIFYIEMKKPGGRVRPEQVQFLKVMRDKGALAGIARSVEDALKIVEG